jgi:uncharacterized protein with HEPN domain
MTRHDANVGLQHMLDYAQEAVEMTRGRQRVDLDTDRQLNLSLVRLLEIIGEAAASVSEEERPKFPGIPWRDIVDLRNRLIHGYDSVNFDILWAIVQHDLPRLVTELRKIDLPPRRKA